MAENATAKRGQNGLQNEIPNTSPHLALGFSLQESADVLDDGQHVLAHPVEHHHIKWNTK